MKTALPADCRVFVFVSLCLNPRRHWLIRGGMAFFLPAAYRVSPGPSVVAAAIHTGWIALMKTVSSCSLPVALESRQPVNTGNFKESCLMLMWSARLPLFTLGDSLPKKKKFFFFFIFRSAGAFWSMRSISSHASPVIFSPRPGSSEYWGIGTKWRRVDVVYSINAASLSLHYTSQLVFVLVTLQWRHFVCVLTERCCH